jgi:hypothetical protein
MALVTHEVQTMTAILPSRKALTEAMAMHGQRNALCGVTMNVVEGAMVAATLRSSVAPGRAFIMEHKGDPQCQSLLLQT